MEEIAAAGLGVTNPSSKLQTATNQSAEQQTAQGPYYS
jgi:hypothetical protein